MTNKKKRTLSVSLRTGVTLIELMVAISIIAILASIVLTNVHAIQVRNEDMEKVHDINEIAKALELYHYDHHKYPNEYPEYEGGPSYAQMADNRWEAEWGGWSLGLMNYLVPEYLPEVIYPPKNGPNGPDCEDGCEQGYFFVSSSFGAGYMLCTATNELVKENTGYREGVDGSFAEITYYGPAYCQTVGCAPGSRADVCYAYYSN